MLIARRLAVIVTLKCTLNCKLCCNCVTMYKNPPIIDKKMILQDIKAAFEIYDRIEWLQFVGGELFLHPDIAEILELSFEYEQQFDKIILMTNGTLIPSKNALSVLEKHKNRIEVQISDYGKLSYRIKEIETLLEGRGIPFVTKKFYGDMQHYGGWVDSGSFENRGYSETKVKELFENCWQISMKNLHMYNGQIHNCIRSLFATDLGKLVPPISEYIDVRNSNVTLAEKKEIANNFNTRPLAACMLCNGFDSQNSTRYPAAEQE